MNTRKLVSLMFLAVLLAALINTRMFGLPTMAAFFFFSAVACFTVVAIGARLLVGNYLVYFSYPLHMLISHLLGGYIAMHGLLTDTWSVTHNYLIIAILYFTAAHFIGEWDKEKGVIISILRKGVLWLALFESGVVILQAIHVLPSWSTSFLATGTWSNPNVTAMYLSISLFFAFNILSDITTGKWKVASVVVILLAIILLQCRTAYLVCLAAILMYYWYNVKSWLTSKIPVSAKIVIPLIIIIIVAATTVMFQRMKQGSVSGRLLIYQNCMLLVKDQPLSGLGFGLFEKTYNRYVAEHNLPSNGSVNMAYNDFLEILVEGGIIALLLWLCFLGTAAVRAFRKGYSLFPVFAFLIIQTVNFGFQAVPVFALLLLAMAIPVLAGKKDPQTNRNLVTGSSKWLFKKVIAIIMLILALIIGVCQLKIAIAWRKVHEISVKRYGVSTGQFKELEEWLQGQAYFHEKFGDAWLNRGDAISANEQYKKCLQFCSYPSVLIKYGYSFQVQNKYDSSLLYYHLARNIEPFKFATRLVILKMYEQQKDTMNIKKAARDILDMSVKVQSDKVDDIKQYASNIIYKIK